ncbi:MAG: nitroreductase family protein [Klebsiella quasipneumoniae]|nr:nitroreductase family protein [Klebsiella quasipneumoniae]
MDFLELSKKRFTAKLFDETKKISDADFATLKEILRLSPSSVNSQPWVFITGSSEEAKKKIRPAVADFNWPRLDTCSHFVVIAVRRNLTETFLKRIVAKEQADGRIESDEVAKEYHESRKFFVDMRETTGETLNWVSRQAYIAMTTLLYGAASMGIDSTPIEGFDHNRLNELLNLDNFNLDSVLIVTLGYDAKEDKNRDRIKSRLSEDILFFNLK